MLAEISATQDRLDLNALAESMDLTVAEVNDLFDRADKAWENIKLHHCPDVGGHRSRDQQSEAAPVNFDDLPMKEFEVTVTRIGYGSRTVRLSAKTLQHAFDIADDDAGNHLYNEHTSEYGFTGHAVE